MDIEAEKLKFINKKVTDILAQQSWFIQHGMELYTLFFRFFLFGAGFFVVYILRSWWKLTGLVIMSYAYYGIGITGTHESRHNSFVQSPRSNKIWAYFFSDFWSAQSNKWWHERHVVKHHVYTNIPGKEIANFYYPWLSKYLYFFVVPYLVLFWLIGKSIHFLKNDVKGLLAYTICMIAGFAFHIWLFSFIFPFWIAVLAMIFMRILFAPIFMHLAIFNHIGLENPPERMPWLSLQTKTTRNVKRNWFLTGIGGNAFVECHLEHHLFPTLSNKMLNKVRPLVRSFLQQEGYVYVEEGYFKVLGDSLRNYEMYFKGTDVAI